MPWDVRFHAEFAEDAAAFETDVKIEIEAGAILLSRFGPHLGRPHADTLKGSTYPNMKELRFQAADGVWRVAFAFDHERAAILLVAGDKTGMSERLFYRRLIVTADRRFTEHLSQFKTEQKGLTMAIPANEVFSAMMTPKQRAEAARRADERTAQYLTLQQLRHARELTQIEVAGLLGKKQASIAQLEKRADMLLSTLRSHVEAMGGDLSLVVRFPDAAPVVLSGLSDDGAQRQSGARPKGG